MSTLRAEELGATFSKLDEDHMSEEGILWSSSYEEAKLNLINKSGLEGIYISDEDDCNEAVSNAIETMLNNNTECYYLYPVVWIDDPSVLIKKGFFPCCPILSLTGKILSDYVDGVGIKTLKFWWEGDKEINVLRDLHYVSRWVYCSPHRWFDKAISEALSLPFKYNYPDLLYKQSKRPINNMQMFRSPKNKAIERSNIFNNTIVGTSQKVIPVTRYASGMSKGKYQNSVIGNFIGTFYYKEEGSTTYLSYKKSHTSFNKHTACIKLYQEYLRSPNPKESIVRAFQSYFAYDNSFLEQWIDGKMTRDLMMTPLEVSKYILQDDKQILQAAKLPQNKYYAANILGLYAYEDGLDQPLAKLARELGYDIVILTNMVGSFQIVEEVLDVRDRRESFDSLIYTY